MPPKYLRRLLSIPVVIGLAIALIVGFPLWFAIAFVIDLFIGIRRQRAMRVVVFLIWILGIELTALTRGTAIWIRHGAQVKGQHAQARLQNLLRFYGHSIWKATERVFGLRHDVHGLEVLHDRAPVLVFGHHTSILDSVLPVEVVAHMARYELRYVIKKTLAYAPVFDIPGHWLPIHFVDRTGKRVRDEKDGIAEIAKDLRPGTAPVIFPEGTFYTPKRHARAVEKLAEQDPTLVDRARALRHVLPPRPAGALAMMDAEPNADIVFIAHVGFEPYVNMAKIFANLPFRRPIEVQLWRVARERVPIDPQERYRWLFGEFERMDAWVSERLDGPARHAA